VESAALAAFLSQLELLSPPWKPGRATHIQLIRNEGDGEKHTKAWKLEDSWCKN
jgi:hypothetical protein